MNGPLTLDLSDDAYAELRRQAEAGGTSAEHLAATSLEHLFRPKDIARGGAADPTARDRFERHFGELRLQNATDADNDRIDADLAREFGDTHEDA